MLAYQPIGSDGAAVRPNVPSSSAVGAAFVACQTQLSMGHYVSVDDSNWQ